MIRTTYFEDHPDVIKKEETLNKEGKTHGGQKFYFHPSQIPKCTDGSMSNSFFIPQLHILEMHEHGKRHGIRKVWNNQYVVIKSQTWRNGLLHGCEEITLYGDKLDAERFYCDGERTDTPIWFETDGHKIVQAMKKYRDEEFQITVRCEIENFMYKLTNYKQNTSAYGCGIDIHFMRDCIEFKVMGFGNSINDMEVALVQMGFDSFQCTQCTKSPVIKIEMRLSAFFNMINNHYQ